MTSRRSSGSGDGAASKAWLRALTLTAQIAKRPGRSLPLVIEERAASLADSPALLADEGSLSYRELAERTNHYARWAIDQGLAKGETVCLLMPNCPEYLAIWLGITRAGGVVALLNTQLTGASLAHCIALVNPRLFVVSAAMVSTLRPALSHRPSTADVWIHGASHTEFPRVDVDMAGRASQPISAAECPFPELQDRALYIYTSGTTGLPKAAIVTHSRLMRWSHWFAGLIDTNTSDRMYDCLPMYHSVGGIVAPGAVLVGGGALVVREGFSAREFWSDVVRWDCTLFQYIGEVCRYLLRAAPGPYDTQHRIRLCCGNGMRAEVWEDFKARFRISRVLEFYAATEGNVSLYNVEGKPGALGRIPAFLAHRFPIALVKYDFGTGRPFRDERQFCEPCGPDEIGEALGRIPAGASASGIPFEGYTDEGASEEKILRSVFEPGDAWFRTGDLMRRDTQGWFYFIDRVGDTFRWKGENVSTAEVAQALREFPGIEEALVYGVEIPGHDGRAGMAAIVAAPGLDFGALREFLHGRLPAYARPLFIRRTHAVTVTGTLKPVKTALLEDGYDPTSTTDAIYFDDQTCGRLVLLDTATLARVRSGRLRL